jgi:hypothetical protein
MRALPLSASRPPPRGLLILGRNGLGLGGPGGGSIGRSAVSLYPPVRLNNWSMCFLCRMGGGSCSIKIDVLKHAQDHGLAKITPAHTLLDVLLRPTPKETSPAWSCIAGDAEALQTW